MNFKINYHSHTRYSDGCDTIKTMALKAKELGFCCHVITDHFYGRGDSWASLTRKTYLKSVEEAKAVSDKIEFPIFVGIEAGFERAEEINIFGSYAIDFFFSKEGGSYGTYETYKHMRENHDCACILNHPSLHKFFEKNGLDIIDGFEACNSGGYFFKEREEELQRLLDAGKHAFSNSDAHGDVSLDRGYNVIDSSVSTEAELIRSIRKGPTLLYTAHKGIFEIGDRNGIIPG